jgi:nucleotide-binding universal stress UspA family protein
MEVNQSNNGFSKLRKKSMYSRILVAIDDNETSKLALQEAIKLAADQKAALRIVYVADEFIPAGEGVHVDFKKNETLIIKQGKAILKEMLAIARKSHHKVEGHLIEINEPSSNISAKIIDEAQKWNADLIVLGTHGRSGLPRLLLGSVAEEVMRNTTVPVHIVHK